MPTAPNTVLIEGFTVRIVQQGDAYGLNDCLIHEQEKPLVEFYDATQSKAKFGERGQFVSRYYCDTILQQEGFPQGLLLQGGVWEWSVSPKGMQSVVEHIRANCTLLPSIVN